MVAKFPPHYQNYKLKSKMILPPATPSTSRASNTSYYQPTNFAVPVKDSILSEESDEEDFDAVDDEFY